MHSWGVSKPSHRAPDRAVRRLPCARAPAPCCAHGAPDPHSQLYARARMSRGSSAVPILLPKSLCRRHCMGAHPRITFRSKMQPATQCTTKFWSRNLGCLALDDTFWLPLATTAILPCWHLQQCRLKHRRNVRMMTNASRPSLTGVDTRSHPLLPCLRHS